MFNMKIVNDDVEREFVEIFGDQAIDMKTVTAKVLDIKNRL